MIGRIIRKNGGILSRLRSTIVVLVRNGFPLIRMSVMITTETEFV